jgi:hypothetical protein
MRRLIFVAALLILCAACEPVTPPPDRRASVSTSIVIDPTVELEPVLAPSADDSRHVFVKDCRSIVIDHILPHVVPGDVVHLTSISQNSAHGGQPVRLAFPRARNNRERQAFIGLRGSSIEQVGSWFGGIAEHLPCVDPKTPCSDVFSAVRTAAGLLSQDRTERKVLVILSDGQDTTAAQRTAFAANAFQGIDIVVLYAFPPSRRPADYEPYRMQLINTLAAGHPRSIRVLLPTEARSFDLAAFIDQLRREP